MAAVAEIAMAAFFFGWVSFQVSHGFVKSIRRSVNGRLAGKSRKGSER